MRHVEHRRLIAT